MGGETAVGRGLRRADGKVDPRDDNGFEIRNKNGNGIDENNRRSFACVVRVANNFAQDDRVLSRNGF
jgi:hypothetical protein